MSNDKSQQGCPFYAFHALYEEGNTLMIDSGGNQCALQSSNYSPCYREMEGKNPSWDECKYNNPEMRGHIQEQTGEGKLRVLSRTWSGEKQERRELSFEI